MKFKSLALVLAMTVCITQNTSYASTLPNTQTAKPHNLMSEITTQPIKYNSLLELASQSALTPMSDEQLDSIKGGDDVINRFAGLTPNQVMLLTIGFIAFQAGNTAIREVIDFGSFSNSYIKAADSLGCQTLAALGPGFMRQSQLRAANLQNNRAFGYTDGVIGIIGGLGGAIGGGACTLSLVAMEDMFTKKTIEMDKKVVDAVNANVTNTPNGRKLFAKGKDINDFVTWHADDLTTTNGNAASAKQDSYVWTNLYNRCMNGVYHAQKCNEFYKLQANSIVEYLKQKSWSDATLKAVVYKIGEWSNNLGVGMNPLGRKMNPKFYAIVNDPDLNNPSAHR